MIRWRYFTVVPITILIVLGCLSACMPPPPQTSATTPEEKITVNSTFREFYQNLGDQEILGPAISLVFSHENIYCQYTENVLMCFDSLANDLDRWFLFELGTTFEITEFTDPINSGTEGDGVVDPIQIYEEFQPMYDRLYGARYVGKPLTPVRYNPYKQRFEQYFENVGFYRLLDAPRGDVHLLSYGAYVCDEYCRSAQDGVSAIVDLPENVTIPFLPYLIRMGSPLAFGEPISHPLPYQDNQIFQVYETVAFAGNPDVATSIHLLNLPELLNMPRHSPGPQVYSEADGVVFYPVEGENGFHIPNDFDKFIVRNAGYEFSGPPIGSYFAVEEGKVYRQCFQNYCLDYDATKEPGQKVSIVPLGKLYSEYANLPDDQIIQFQYSPETVLFTISEVEAQIPANQPQEIDMVVLMRKNGLPLENIEAFLSITLPDGETIPFDFPPTSADGTSSFTIPAQPQLSNGDLVVYEVCLNIPSEQPFCQQDNYLIWDHK